MSYCSAIPNMSPESRQELHRRYHDHLYGFPIHNDNELFGRLILEINQAGLSWETILKKEDAFRDAYDQFDIATIANYSDTDRERLLADAGIIRNKLKIDAVIANAKVLISIQQSHGSFKNWLDSHHPMDIKEWMKVFKKQFKFTGGEILNEFLMSTGYLKGAHDETCPIYQKVLASNPAWLTPKE